MLLGLLLDEDSPQLSEAPCTHLHYWRANGASPLKKKCIETVSPEGLFCDTVQVPSCAGGMELI